MTKKQLGIAAIGILIFSGFRGCGPLAQIAYLGGDEIFRNAYQNHQSDVQVTGKGSVVEVLPDDVNGTRHQRFILQLSSGQTILVAHNIDLATRIPSLEVGDVVGFRGVYE